MKTALLLTAMVLSAYAGATNKADLNGKTLDGRKVHLKDLRGKLVVVNFWATWCGPCKEEMPMMAKTAQESGNSEVIFLSVSVDDASTQAQVSEAAKQLGIPFPVWVGASGDDLYRLSQGEAVPTTVLIDRDGTVQASVSGEIREGELKVRLAWLTGDRKGEKPKEFVSHIE